MRSGATTCQGSLERRGDPPLFTYSFAN
jgi:hypothetical protein